MKIIGIIMRKESFEQCEKWFVNEAYITALQKLNAIIFPICDYASLSYAQEICHGLIVPGGYDIFSGYWQEEQSSSAKLYPYPMDHFDFCCIDAFMKQKKPILGICRGIFTARSIRISTKLRMLQTIPTHYKFLKTAFYQNYMQPILR